MKNEMKNKLSFWKVFSVLLLFVISCKKQEQGFIIKGQIIGMKEIPKKVYLFNEIGSPPADSANIENGKFILKGHINHPRIAAISAGKSRAELILENETFEAILGDQVFMVKGGKMNEIVYGFTYEKDFQENFKKMKMLGDQYDMFEAKKKKKSQDSVLLHYKKIQNKLFAIQDKYQKNILTQDYPALVKAYTLNNYYDTTAQYSTKNRLALLDTYEKEIGKDESITKIRNQYLDEQKQQENTKSVTKGHPFKDIEATTADGKKIKLSEIIKKNKYTMLDFWASWCMPCRAEFPNQRKAYKQYHQKGFEIYAVSLDDTMKSWLKALEKENTPWYNLIVIKGMKGNSTNAYGVNSIPATFLIAQNGTIIASGDELRGNGLEKVLKNLFK